MRLLRVGPAGHERPAALDRADRLLDLSGVVSEIDGGWLAGDGIDAARAAIESGELAELDPSIRIGPPVARPGKVVCIGLNYSDHAAETGATAPTEPVLFLKTPDTVVGPYDEVLVPRSP